LAGAGTSGEETVRREEQYFREKNRFSMGWERALKTVYVGGDQGKTRAQTGGMRPRKGTAARHPRRRQPTTWPQSSMTGRFPGDGDYRFSKGLWRNLLRLVGFDLAGDLQLLL